MIAHNARSPQLAAAARLVAIVWFFSLQLWIVLDGDAKIYGFIALDFALAIAFFQMSRGSWFPVPLFFLHAILVIYHLFTIIVEPALFWVQILLNRAFELELAYIIACACYRVFCLRLRGV